MGGATVPLSQVVLKVHSLCDLSCDHCYVYAAVDQSWRSRPRVISDEVVTQAGRRIAEHAVAHGLPEVQVVLHGGEPLLAGYDGLRQVITGLHRALDGICRLDLRIHTNGVQLSSELCELFAEHRVKVGISLDGDRAANDRHRRYANGRSSYDKVIRAIELLNTGRFRGLFAGLLCTIDVANDPLVVYESLMALRPPRIDFLLPHSTWDHPPRRTPGADHEYADWLQKIYDRWAGDGRPVEIRTFDSIVATLRGGQSRTEALGLGPTGLVVIESDGSYEQVDSLKVAFEGAPATGMNVFSHSLDLVAQHPGITAREQGLAGLCQTCQECPVVSSCGGGLYTHRYRDGRGFANPSVFCADLFALITHVSEHLPVPEAASTPHPPHTVSTASFDALAAGQGDATAVGSLIQAQRSLVRALLSAVYQEAITAPSVAAPVREQLRAAWGVLTGLDQDRPGALRTVLDHPPLRAWAVHCLDQLRAAPGAPGARDLAPGAGRLAADLGHLGGIAAAAAAYGRVSAAVRVPVLDGAVHLPTLGRLVLSPEQAAGPAGGDGRTVPVSVISNAVIIQADESCWTLDLPDRLAGQVSATPAAGNNRSAEWQPVRALCTAGWRLALEDTDPYRDCYPWPAASRLTEAEVARWQRHVQLAWPKIEQQYPVHAPGLAPALGTLIPLASVQGRPEVSAVARQAFGAVAVSPAVSPASLAWLLIQEWQRAKLGVVLDLFDLYDQADDRLFPAPWGEEKLPLDGLLQGAYVRLAAPGGRSAEWRAQTCQAIGILLDSGALTPLGMRFAGQMRHSLAGTGTAAGPGQPE